MTTPTASLPRRAAAAVCVAVASIVGVVAVVGLSSTAHAAGLPLDRAAAIAVRALGYDRGLKARAGTHVDLLVVTTAASKDIATAAFASLDGVNVQGVPLSVVVTTAAADDLGRLLDDRGADAVFVADARGDAVAPLAAQALRRGFLLIVSDRAHLQAGGHLAVVDAGGKPRLVVALAAARAARIELGSELLNLAEVLR